MRDPAGVIPSPLGRLAPNPLAENVENHKLRHHYWIRQIPGKDGDWIKVYVLGEYGATFDGKPVYKDVWNEAVQVTDICCADCKRFGRCARA